MVIEEAPVEDGEIQQNNEVAPLEDEQRVSTKNFGQNRLSVKPG